MPYLTKIYSVNDIVSLNKEVVSVRWAVDDQDDQND